MSSFEKDCKGNAKSEYSKAFGGKLNLLERYKQIIGEKVCVLFANPLLKTIFAELLTI